LSPVVTIPAAEAKLIRQLGEGFLRTRFPVPKPEPERHRLYPADGVNITIHAAPCEAAGKPQTSINQQRHEFEQRWRANLNGKPFRFRPMVDAYNAQHPDDATDKKGFENARAWIKQQAAKRGQPG
jgi:hypothetical protein